MPSSDRELKVAVVKGDFGYHGASWEPRWIEILQNRGIKYSYIDWRKRHAIRLLAQHHIILWMFSHYSPLERSDARGILFALEQAGVAVFPSFNDAWHFDDKIAQAFLFEALGTDVPINDILYSKDAVEDWIVEVGEFPVVAKLRSGSGSHNVKLIQDASSLRKYARRAFGPGFNARPSLSLKMASNFGSAKSFGQLMARVKRLPDFLHTMRQTRGLDREKGYVYLQRFVRNATYDLKIAVVNGKLGFIVRDVRRGDFRASGGGALGYDRSFVTPQVQELAYRLYDRMGALCTGMDIVIDQSGKPLVIETSYGFSSSAMLAGGGHFNREGSWITEPLDAPREVLDAMISIVQRRDPSIHV